VGLADQLTVARVLAVPFVVALYAWNFDGHAYWATGLFVVAMATDWFDGRIARRHGRTSPLGGLLDPIADKILVLSVLIVLIGLGVFEAWMVAAIVAREFLISGLRLAAIERGVVMHARDLGKLKTWSQAIVAAVERGVVIQARDLGKLKTWSQAVATALGGFAAAGAWDQSIAWWGLLVAVVLTWVSGLDYARVAPGLLRGRAAA
jgi:CDP-diacylglycerol--glycerol-3-phosphate 3-phosphatidyltransferase